MVLPVAAIVSLVRSHREVRQQGLAHLKRPIEWILISQIAGGTLAIVFTPVLAVIARNDMARSALALVIWALGLLTPLAFAAAVWKYNVLAVSPDTTNVATKSGYGTRNRWTSPTDSHR